MNDQNPSPVPAKYLDDFLTWHDCRPEPTGDECDPRALEELKCRNTGVAAESEYRTGHQKDLEDAHTSFATAKTSYQAAQRDAAVKIQDLTHRVRVLIERVRCQIEQPSVVRCLDEAFETVCAELDCCEDPVCGCTVEAVEFDTAPPRKQGKLVRRVRRYQKAVDDARAAFAALVAEPSALTARVAKAEAEVKAVEAALAGDTPPDLKQIYARVLVVRRSLERRRIWNGFETYAEFVDCLCRALATWSDGVEAVAVLTGELARRTCRKANADLWCTTLEADPVAEILSVYERECGSRECDDVGETDDAGEPTQTHKPDRYEDKPKKDPHRHDDDCGCDDDDRPKRPHGGHPGYEHHGHHHDHHGHWRGTDETAEPAGPDQDDEGSTQTDADTAG